MAPTTQTSSGHSTLHVLRVEKNQRCGHSQERRGLNGNPTILTTGVKRVENKQQTVQRATATSPRLHGSPKRIQRRRSKGWKLPENTVCVSRPGPWGNPFIVGKHGTQAECVELYERLMGGLLCISLGHECVEAQEKAVEHAINHLPELRGKNLACWCREGTPCHADVLLKMAND